MIGDDLMEYEYMPSKMIKRLSRTNAENKELIISTVIVVVLYFAYFNCHGLSSEAAIYGTSSALMCLAFIKYSHQIFVSGLLITASGLVRMLGGSDTSSLTVFAGLVCMVDSLIRLSSVKNRKLISRDLSLKDRAFNMVFWDCSPIKLDSYLGSIGLLMILFYTNHFSMTNGEPGVTSALIVLQMFGGACMMFHFFEANLLWLVYYSMIIIQSVQVVASGNVTNAVVCYTVEAYAMLVTLIYSTENYYRFDDIKNCEVFSNDEIYQ